MSVVGNLDGSGDKWRSCGDGESMFTENESV